MRFSAPPMIILLDILLVIIFLLALEQSPDIKIILPSNVWLKDTVILSEDKNKKIQHWFNRQTGHWESFKTFRTKKRNRTFTFMLGRIACEDYQYCSNISLPPNSGKKIISIRGDLYDQIAGLISDSCLTFPRECSNVTYHVKKNGTVDVKQLKDKYQIFKLILKE